MEIGATLNCLSGDKLTEQDAEFAEAGDAVAPVEDVELVATHAFQESVVDLAHDLGGAKGPAVGGRQQVHGFLEKADPGGGPRHMFLVEQAFEVVGELVRASMPRVAVLSYSEVVAAQSVETAAVVKMEA